jgi:plasmid maintenance system antidote protein VapI
MIRRLIAPLLVLLLGGGLQAQNDEVDPRLTEDPRETRDPRMESDPREVAIDPLEAPPGPMLYDALYDAELEVRLATVFRENAWSLLSYIDGYCEAWLAMVERGDLETESGRARVEEVKAKGRRLALMADTAIGTSRFGLYVETFYAWNDGQQQLLREGQALYRDAIQQMRSAPSVQAAQTALTPLHQALSRARQISDTWGQAMALAAIGNLQASGGMLPEAHATLGEALRLGREIRDLDSVWDALSLRYELAMATRDYDRAAEALLEQHVIAQDVGDEAVVARVMQQLVNLEVYRRAARGG